jgi:hypothetical protein
LLGRPLEPLHQSSFLLLFFETSQAILNSLGSLAWPGTCYVAQTDLELKILLPEPPKCWDYRHVPPQQGSISNFWMDAFQLKRKPSKNSPLLI